MKQLNSYEPKKTNRFVVEFPEEFGIETFTVFKTNNPEFIDGQWQNIEIIFRDYVGASVTEGLYNIINFAKTNNDKKILFNVEIKMLDPVGVSVQCWDISVEKIVEISFGNLDYSVDEVLCPYIVIKPFDCVLEY